MEQKLTAQEIEIVNSNQNMTRYLRSLKRGRPETPRSGLYEKYSPETVRDMGLAKLKTLEGDDTTKLVYQFDLASLSKGGPQGEVKPIDELLDDVIYPSFAEHSPAQAFETKEGKAAKTKTVDILTAGIGKRRLRPRDLEHVVDDMRSRDTLESNSGGPLFTKRNKPEVVASAIDDARAGRWKEYPAIVLFRNYNLKTRMVGMYPMSANLIEGSFTQVIQSHLVETDDKFGDPGRGFEKVRLAVTEHYRRNHIIGASDFSATDEHFTEAATEEVFDVVKEMFQDKYGDLLHESMIRVNNIPLVIGEDKKLVGKHGVSSGSNGTNLMETLFDRIFAEYVHTCFQMQLNVSSVSGIYAIGDDMSGMTENFLEEFPHALEQYGKQVGQIVKAEKTTYDPRMVKSLQRLFIKGYNVSKEGQELTRGIYPSIRALKSALYPEKFHAPKLGSSDMFCARIYMILENCVDHPLFEDFVKFVVQGQKDLIPFAKLSKDKLNKITRETKLLPGFNPTYNQEKRDTSLANFESISIAAKLR